MVEIHFFLSILASLGQNHTLAHTNGDLVNELIDKVATLIAPEDYPAKFFQLNLGAFAFLLRFLL